jgi:cytochrome oxidase assembly protein ShyY1
MLLIAQQGGTFTIMLVALVAAVTALIFLVLQLQRLTSLNAKLQERLTNSPVLKAKIAEAQERASQSETSPTPEEAL